MTESTTERSEHATDAPTGAFALPSHWYTDPATFARERTAIYRRDWIYAGNAHSIPDNGDFFTFTVAGVPLVLARTQDGALAGFVNICRHRLHHVAEGSGNATRFTCRYHGWSYDTCGHLLGAPRSRYEDDFDKAELGLAPIAVETWGPLIFVNLDVDAAPLADTLGPLPALAQERELNFGLTLHCREHVPLRCNWKVAIDNALECYHCPTVHPSLSQAFELTRTGFVVETFERTLAAVSAPRGDDADGGMLHGYYVWPNLWLSGRGDSSFFVIQFDPVDAGSCSMLMEHYYAADIEPAELQEKLTATRALLDEDAAVCEPVQRAHESGAAPRGRFLLNSEEQLRWFAGIVYETVAP